MRHSSPLRYPGGKARIFNFFDRLFYENNLLGSEYAEPYAGGAGLALKLLYKGYVSRIHLNDLDSKIFAIWRGFLERPNEFCDWVSEVSVDIDSWVEYQNIYKNYQKYHWFEVAKAAFFINRTSVSGVLKGAGVIGGLDQKGRSKIDARFNRTELCRRIKKIRSYSDLITFSSEDAVVFIKRFNKRLSKRGFIYLDPPYVKKGSSLYLNHYNKNDHVELSKLVESLEVPWVVSYDESPLIESLYQSFSQIKYSLRQNTSNRIGEELIITSHSLTFNKSMQELNDAHVLSFCRTI